MRICKCVVLFSVFLLLSTASFAATFVWSPAVGTSPYNWNDGGNWKVGSAVQTVPPGIDDVVTMTLSSGYTITMPSSISLTSLAITIATNSDVTFTSGGDFSISTSGNATISGTGFTGKLVSSHTVSLSTTTVSSVTILTNAAIGFPLTVNSALISHRGTTFHELLNITVTGASNNGNNGGNTYKKAVTFVHTGTGVLSIAVTAGDVFEGTVVFDNVGGAGSINFGYAAGNVFKDPVTLKNASAAATINIGFSGEVTLQDNAYFYADAAGFQSGNLRLARINQVNSLASTLETTGAGTIIVIGSDSEFKGNVYLKAYNIGLSGKTTAISTEQNIFHGKVRMECSQGTSTGANSFLKGLELILATSSTSSQSLMLTNAYPDNISGGDLTVSVRGAGSVYLAIGAELNLDGNLIIDGTGTGNLYLGHYASNNRKIIQTENKVFKQSGAGYAAGIIYIYGYQQSGDLNNFEETSMLDVPARIVVGSSSETDSAKVTFKSPINWKASFITLNFGLYYSAAIFESKTGVTNVSSASCPNMHFYKKLTIHSSGTNLFVLGAAYLTECTLYAWEDVEINQNSSSSTSGVSLGRHCRTLIYGNLTINQTAGAGNIEIGVFGNGICTNTVDIKGNIVLNRTGTGMGAGGAIRFGYNSLVKHNASKNISVGSWAYGGTIYFTNFQQYNPADGLYSISLPYPTLGTSVINIPTPVIGSGDDVAANWSGVQLGATSVFMGPLTVTASGFAIFGGTYYSPVVLTKKNNNTNTSGNGAVFDFKSSLTINHNGTSGFLYVLNHADDVGYFRGDVVLNATATSSGIYFCRIGTARFYGNLTNSTSYTPSFGTGGGIFIFEGCNAQTITSTPTLTIPRLKINKDCNDITLNAPLQISVYGDFTKGRLIIPKDGSGNSLYLLNFTNTSVSMNSNSSSFVDGTVRKTGLSGGAGFAFPIGSGSVYMPVRISELCTTSAIYEATYYNKAQTNGNTLGTGVKDLSNCQYWYLNRIAGSCSITATLPWTEQTCHLVNKDVMLVAQYSSSQWTNVGNNSLTGNNTAGTVTSNAATQFGYLTLGYSTSQFIDTRNVYQSSYTIGDGADNHSTIYTSGASGSSSGNKTLLAAQNTTPGILLVHPDKSPACVEINVVAAANNNALNMCLPTDANGVVAGATVSGNAVSADYYTLNTNTIVFYSNKKTDGAISITNNLVDGMIWKKTSNPTLSFSIGGNVFDYAYLYVKSSTGAEMHNAPVSFTGSSINWSGSSITTDGLYIYELSLGTTSGDAKTYTGNMVVKMYE